MIKQKFLILVSVFPKIMTEILKYKLGVVLLFNDYIGTIKIMYGHLMSTYLSTWALNVH